MTTILRIRWDRKYTTISVLLPLLFFGSMLLFILGSAFLLMVRETGIEIALTTWQKYFKTDDFLQLLMIISVVAYLPLPYALNLRLQDRLSSPKASIVFRTSLRATLQTLLYLLFALVGFNIVGRIIWFEHMNGAGHPRAPYETIYLALVPVGFLWLIECHVACWFVDGATSWLRARARKTRPSATPPSQ